MPTHKAMGNILALAKDIYLLALDILKKSIFHKTGRLAICRKHPVW